MTVFKKAALLCSLAVAFCLTASSAFAGPIWSFGDEDQGLLKLDYKGQFQFLNRDTGASPDGEGDANEFNFRRNRIALMGAYGDNFGLYVQTEYTEDRNILPYGVSDGGDGDMQILDAVLRFRLSNSFNLWVGKFKYNLTRENQEACEAPLTLDRSVFIRAPFVSTRDKGVALWGNLFEDKFQYRFDVMNGRNDSASSPESNPRFSGRVHVSLLDPEKNYGYKGTYMGQKKVLTFGAAYQTEAGVAYAGTEEVDYSAWTVDAFAEYPIEDIGTFTLSAAYVEYDLDDAYKNGSPDDDVTGYNGEKNGGYVKVGYLLPNMPLQLFARTEGWSFSKLNDVYDQEVSLYSGGFNYYVRGQNLKVTVEYTALDYDKDATIEDTNTFVAQVQVMF
ncbi:selenite/tellurite reduction operon porin ExtI [uncultured Desulfuromusa sp.]|uniref:selenite/tellurite reduction operon porin ExtI n=1 Tax=uncultured Desulfuromusa sp. TaxID=219183 RepID=UPI002AA89B81|nr:selenite/tellurite reduction operon porin ExtI [uncultured Desulfuromusa sp.]